MRERCRVTLKKALSNVLLFSIQKSSSSLMLNQVLNFKSLRAHIAGSTYVGRQDRLCRLELVPVHWSTSNTKSVILILETSVMYEVVYLSFEF